MMIGSNHDEDIRRDVEKGFKQRFVFYAHLIAYILISILFWIIYGLTADMRWQFLSLLSIDERILPLLRLPWPLIVMLGWGVGLLTHGLNFYGRYGGGAIRREAAIQHEIEREMARTTAYEKPKNDVSMRLTDDGELEVIEDEPNWPMKSKHQ